ncbi:MAG TPA: hypothetical protein VJV78_12760 [Polyangiales bacterium]|nr:hypothetical protein [Polyangiales bacterium]
MIERRFVVAGLIGLLASACASSSGFVSSWKSPTAKPLQVQGSKVAAVVMMGDPASRKSAEDRLAGEITAHGAHGVPAYTILEESATTDEATAKAALQKAGVQGVVVVRPSKEDATGKPVDYSVPPYSSYWDSGFYAHGWGQPWIDPRGIPYDMVVTVDTLIYSLPQNQLVWAGKSKKTNPATLNELVSDLADDTADELNRLELVKK